MADQAHTSTATVLVVNAGSSSVKFALLEPTSGRRLIAGIAERLGTPEATLKVEDEQGKRTRPIADGDHTAALACVIDEIRALPAEQHPVAVGHRIVHAGEEYASSVIITDEVIAAIEKVSPLAPLHNPPGLLGVHASSAAWPSLPQVVVFDTAFHQSLPPAAYRYAIPQEWYESYRVRRYGFHGTSHRYVSEQSAALLGRPVEDCQVIVAHLGNGASATAVKNGQSVDTTMGLTPLEGLVMGTRSGDVDPGLFAYLEAVAGLNADQVTAALNSKSGMLALSGISNDMRTISQAAREGDERAVLALEVYVHRLARSLSGLSASLTRLDALAFTGGIGENDGPLRAATVKAMALLGLRVDEARNGEHGASSGQVISPADSEGPAVLVVPTDEEVMIARDALALITEGQR